MPMDIDNLLGSLEKGTDPGLDGPGMPGMGGGLPGIGMPGEDPLGMGLPGMGMPEMPRIQQGMPQNGPPGIPGVSLEDTMKSTVQGSGPALGTAMNPLGGGGMEAFLEQDKPASMATTQTVETTTDEIENPYAFPMDNAAQEQPAQIEETVNKTKGIVMVVAIGIVAVIVLFGIVIGLSKKISGDKNKEQQGQQGQVQQGQVQNPASQPSQQQGSQGSSYNGPRIQTAEPNALAVNDTVYDDVMAITKQIQVENGSVECYLVGTPQYFTQKIKIPVTVQEYNEAKAADIVAIRYRIVRISGQDFVIDPYVVPKEVSE